MTALIVAIVILVLLVVTVLAVVATMRIRRGAVGAANAANQGAQPAGDGREIPWRGIGVGVLIVCALLVAYFCVYGSTLPTPAPSGVGDFGSHKWLWILVLAGLLAGIIALTANGAVRTALLATLCVVTLALIVVLPFWSWATSPSTSPAAAAGLNLPSTAQPKALWPTVQVTKNNGRVRVPLAPGRTITWESTMPVDLNYIYEHEKRVAVEFVNHSLQNDVIVMYAYNN